MSERTSYAPGTPCWVELGGTPDIEAGESFYGDLFGWEIPELPNSAEMGGYRRAKKDGKDVAGVYAADGGGPALGLGDLRLGRGRRGDRCHDQGDRRHRRSSSRWTSSASARWPSSPTRPGPSSGIWQPGTFAGAELVNEHGAFGWNELGTRDPAAAKEFYGAVFGWSAEEQDIGRDGHLHRSGRRRRDGRRHDRHHRRVVPDEVPPHWLVYFTVEDTDAAVEKIKGGGGDVSFGPIDIPVGRFAVVADPFGAVFAVMQPQRADAGVNTP